MENNSESCVEILRHNNVLLCGKDGCKFKHSKDNKYCNKHQICIFLDETQDLGKKTCANYVRGCREQLDIYYKFSRCEDCLKRDREKEKARREEKMKDSNNEGKKKCSSCCIEYTIEHFKGINGGETKTCSKCRENFKISDANRDKEHRNAVARKNDSKPERIAVKNEWKEKNYEKVAGYWMKSRQNKIEKLGVDKYQKYNAENAKNWRENNPEKVINNNEKKRESLKLNYNVYIRTASNKGLEFSISFEEYEKIVCDKCYYCGIIADKGFNGIDRKDQTKGYLLDNCVNCCQMCNYMKGSLNDFNFIKKIEHILTYNKIIENGNLYPEIFANYFNNVIFKKYKDRSNQKKMNFEITESQFKEITSYDCYICGKKNSETHRNGIDRFDSNIGYLFYNCKSCCGECNYLKREYNYNDFIEKIKLINNNLNNLSPKLLLPINNNIEKIKLENTFVPFDNKIIINTDSKDKINIPKNIVKNKNKKTKEEIRENDRIRKQEQRKRLIEKYGDEEYKKMNAKLIAENRRKKKEKEN
uniref:Uncharacterized protein n=1 Tax=viral metagenome TaxID=1070528 RepID=A0A6C0HSX1_9ZZZZ